MSGCLSTHDRGNCATCHRARTDFPRAVLLFTDFGYETLGLPRNRRIPANGDPAFFDLGLGGPKTTLPRGDPSFNAAFKTPILRNVAVKQAFMHNGYFTRLEDVVAFYATRDTDPGRWYPQGQRFDDTREQDRQYINVAFPFGGKPGDAPHLTAQDIVDVVAFLRALTDQEFEAALPPAMSITEVEALLAPAPWPASAQSPAAAPLPGPAPAPAASAR